MKNEDIKNSTPQPILEDYLFAGGGEYLPVTIQAASIAEATEQWEKIKVAIAAEPLLVE